MAHSAGMLMQLSLHRISSYLKCRHVDGIRPTRQVPLLLGLMSATLIVASLFSLYTSPRIFSLRKSGPDVFTFGHGSGTQFGRGAGQRYSWHTCVGGVQDHFSRQCLFRNVCIRLYDYKSSQARPVALFYYRSPEHMYLPVDFEPGTAFPEPFLRLGREQDPSIQNLTPEILYKPFPENDFATKLRAQGVLLASFWPENFGHALGDDMYPAYRSLSRFGWLLDSQVSTDLIMHPSCKDRASPERGCNNVQKVYPLLFDRPPFRFGEQPFAHPTNESSAKNEDVLNSSHLVCYETLIFGGGKQSMSEPGEGSWESFIHHSKLRTGMDVDAMPIMHKIVIINKEGRRKIENVNEMLAHLQKAFPGLDISAVNPAQLSMQKQMELLHQTTVLISPPGGISFSAVFLPRGAQAIFLDYWDTKWQDSASMESVIYRSHTDIATLRYPVNFKEVTVKGHGDPEYEGELSRANSHDDVQWLKYRNWADTRVDVERMTRIVAGALVHTSSSFGLSVPAISIDSSFS